MEQIVEHKSRAERVQQIVELIVHTVMKSLKHIPGCSGGLSRTDIGTLSGLLRVTQSKTRGIEERNKGRRSHAPDVGGGGLMVLAADHASAPVGLAVGDVGSVIWYAGGFVVGDVLSGAAVVVVAVAPVGGATAPELTS